MARGCRTAVLVLGVALVASSGCSDLSGVEAGVCGNAVLEVGEDCDSFEPEALGTDLRCASAEEDNACSFVCSDGFSCPTGWGCGTDNVCRQASGSLAPADGSPWRFKVLDFAIGDVDGDGKEDLVGASQAKVTVRFGNAEGEFPTELDIATRNAVGPPRFVYFDADERLDVVIPLFSGVFALLGQSDGSMLPVPYAPLEVPLDMVAPDETRLLPVEADGDGLASELLVFVGNSVFVLGRESLTKELPPGRNIRQVDGRIPIADINPGDNRDRQEFALAFRGDSVAYIFEVVGEGSELEISERDRINLPGPIRTPAKFADIDGDGALDFMVGVQVNNEVRFAFALSGGILGGNFPDSATTSGAFVSLTDQFPLATGDFDGDSKADYVTENAVYLSATFGGLPGPPTRLFPIAGRTSSNLWAEADVGDFNGDGVADIVIATEESDGLVFLINSGSLLFNTFRIDTDSEPFALRVGDYDGDLIDDVAYGSRGFGIAPDILEVSFGSTSGGPSEPVAMGELGLIRGIEPFNNIQDLESLDAITDLAVVSADFNDPGTVSVATLFGSSQRRLLSPFALTEGDIEDTPIRLAVGAFAGDEARDVVAVSVPKGAINPQGDLPAGSGTSDLEFNAWFIPGEGESGGLSASGASIIGLPSADAFRSDCAEWAVGDLTGDGIDELVGIDRNASCFGRGESPTPRLTIADPSVAPEEGLSLLLDIDTEADFTSTDSLETLDLDLDGDLDVLVRFSGERRTSQDDGTGSLSGAGVLILWNQGGLLSTDRATTTELDLPGVGVTYDAEPINLDSDPEPELAVLTDVGILVVDLDDASPPQFGTGRLLINAAGGGRLEAGDVNGDGVDDLAWTEGPSVEVYHGVPAPPLGGGELASVPREDDEGDGGGDTGEGDSQ